MAALDFALGEPWAGGLGSSLPPRATDQGIAGRTVPGACISLALVNFFLH